MMADSIDSALDTDEMEDETEEEIDKVGRSLVPTKERTGFLVYQRRRNRPGFLL